MTKEELTKHIADLMNELHTLYNNGQKEYANSDDVFGNFNRLATDLKIDRKQILWVYMMKHRDGILSFLNGHKSQRESVHGRIKDHIVYLMLLDAMIVEEENKELARQRVMQAEGLQKLESLNGISGLGLANMNKGSIFSAPKQR